MVFRGPDYASMLAAGIDQALTAYLTRLCSNCSGITGYDMLRFWAKASAAQLLGTRSGLICPVMERGMTSRDALSLLHLDFGALASFCIDLTASVCTSMERASTVTESSGSCAEQ